MCSFTLEKTGELVRIVYFMNKIKWQGPVRKEKEQDLGGEYWSQRCRSIQALPANRRKPGTIK